MVSYAGALSRIHAADSRMEEEFTTGAANGLVGDQISPNPEPSNFQNFPSFQNGVAVISDSGYNIHHFLWEHLPAIYLYRDIVLEHKKILVGMSDLSPTSFSKPLLRFISIDSEVTPLPLHSKIELIESTVVSTFPFRVYPISLVSEVVDEVLQRVSRLEPANDVQQPEVVFLSRGDRERNRRKLVNETDVSIHLGRRWPSLQIIRSGLQPVEHTIRSLGDCRIIVGPTGGALAHILWAKHLEHVIEIVPEEYPGATETEETSRMLGFTNHRVKAHRQGTNLTTPWTSVDHFCDIQELQELLATDSLRARLNYYNRVQDLSTFTHFIFGPLFIDQPCEVNQRLRLSYSRMYVVNLISEN
jgi:capsular polysaccharide biosynthesis protein